jgi:uncharacterized protein YecE (DUF72 family)
VDTVVAKRSILADKPADDNAAAHGAEALTAPAAGIPAYIGTSGWAYASWKPGFYPPKLAAKKFLEYYATQLNSVEVNYTFRQLPTAGMLATWLAASADGFRFSFKAPQRITHFQRLKDCADQLESLALCLEPVVRAGRMGVVLFQLPPNFKADAGLLAGFLSGADKFGLRMAFEFRHSSWFAEEIIDLLREHQAALCVAESDELETPDVVTAPFACYRLRKSDYTLAELCAIVQTLQTRAAHGDVFAYFKHEDDPDGALRAVETLQRLRQE